MSEKPKKRLVGRREYLQTACKRALLHSSAMGIGYLGLVLLVMSWYGVRNLFVFLWDPQQSLLGFCVAAVAYCAAGIRAIRYANTLYRKSQDIEPVALITKSSTKHLPEAETLVRGSDRPETSEQTELLHAVYQTPESQPEQLLRATQDNRQDV